MEYQQAWQDVINYLRRVDPEQFNGPLAHPGMLDDPVDDHDLIYLAKCCGLDADTDELQQICKTILNREEE